MNKKAERMLKNEFETQLRRQYQTGLAHGSKAVSQIIKGKAEDGKKTEAERLEDIIKFCSVALNGK